MSDLNDLKKKVQTAYGDWEKDTYGKFIAEKPERENEFTTVSFSKIDPLYTPLNYSDVNYLDKVGLPGKFPFTRGIQPNMYRGSCGR